MIDKFIIILFLSTLLLLSNCSTEVNKPNLSNTRIKVDNLTNLAYREVIKGVGNYDRFLINRSLNKAEELADSIKYFNGLGEVEYIKGAIAVYEDNYYEALNIHFNDAQNFFKKSKNIVGQIKCLNGIAESLRRILEYQTGFKTLGYKILFEETKEKYLEAIEEASKGNLKTDLDLQITLLFVYNNLTELYFLKPESKKEQLLLKYIDKAGKLVQDIEKQALTDIDKIHKFKRCKGFYYDNLGIYNLYQNEPADKIINHLKTSLEIRKVLDTGQEIALSYMNIGEFYLDHNVDSAYIYLNEGRKLARKSERDIYRERCLNLLMYLFEKYPNKRNDKIENEVLRELNEVKDQRRKKGISIQFNKYQADKKQAEDKRSSQINLLLLIGSISVALLLCLLLWKTQQGKKKLNQKHKLLSILHKNSKSLNRLVRRTKSKKEFIEKAIESTMNTIENTVKKSDSSIFQIGIYDKVKNGLSIYTKEKSNNSVEPDSPIFISLDTENRLPVVVYNRQKNIVEGDYRKNYKNYVNKLLPPLVGESANSIIYVKNEKLLVSIQSFKKNAYTPADLQTIETISENILSAYKNVSAIERANIVRIEEREKRSRRFIISAMFSHQAVGKLPALKNTIKVVRDLVDKSQFDGVSLIQDQSLNLINRISISINNLFNWTKKEIEDFELDKKNIDLNNLINKFPGVEEDAKERKINLKFEIDNDAAIGFADEMMLKMVIQELMSNAVSFTKEGYVIFRSKRIKESSDIAISIEDTGCGINEEDLKLLFANDIEREEIGECKEGKGSGFGLPMCQQIIGKHDSKIKVESKVGEGSTFYFELKGK